MDWTTFPDIAAERLGGAVLAANDEFFAPKESLLAPGEPVWDPHRYTDRGKWMDGWETRRRRDAGHDWALVRLGLPGIVRGLVVDTAHFKGNYPEQCAVAACSLPGHPDLAALEDPATEWIEILPRSALRGDARNLFPVESPWSFTHLRLEIHPDGGVARLRVHGRPLPRLSDLEPGRELDLAALEYGGRVVGASDTFFGPPANLLLPGPPLGMADGWETRRRRGPGHDWAVIRLAGGGTIRRVEVDTTWFKGNAPGSCALDGALVAEGTDAAEEAQWAEILPRSPLLAHTRHRFAAEVRAAGEVTHARLRIYPDGGVARLRLWGELTEPGREALGLERLNALPSARARGELLACCGSPRWAERMAAARPFADRVLLERAAEEIWNDLERDDWLAAFAAHPRIGERPEAGTDPRAATWSEQEQAGAAADGDLRSRLAAGNRAYEERFGHAFIVRAAGRSAAEMLALLESRLGNEPEAELRVAAAQQAEISRLRLRRLLGGS